jgi:hypothetical protein
VFTVTLRYWRKATIVANPNEGTTTLLIPDEWLELMEWEVFYRILCTLNRYDEATNLIMPAMQPKMPSPAKNLQRDIGIIPRLWNELLTTIDERESIDDDFSINPVRLNG